VNLVLRPAAAADVEEAFLWYEAQRAGLGHEFLSAIEEVLKAILQAPNAYPAVHRNTRRAHVTRFPYGVFYRLAGQEVVVVACFHGRRNPRKWEGRG
jgi:plasmid stabilization system protein ParE